MTAIRRSWVFSQRNLTMLQVGAFLAAVVMGLAGPACAEQMQVSDSPVALDLPNGFKAAHGGLENEGLGALVRVFTDRDFAFWQQFFSQVSARAYKQGKLNRSDEHLYFYVRPNTGLAEFNLVFNQAAVTAKVIFEVRTESIRSNSITLDDIERILSSAHVVPPAVPARP